MNSTNPSCVYSYTKYSMIVDNYSVEYFHRARCCILVVATLRMDQDGDMAVRSSNEPERLIQIRPLDGP